jgi:hypothetical protein
MYAVRLADIAHLPAPQANDEDHKKSRPNDGGHTRRAAKLGCRILEPAMRLNSRSLAFRAAGKGEARTAPLKGAEASMTESTL